MEYLQPCFMAVRKNILMNPQEDQETNKKRRCDRNTVRWRGKTRKLRLHLQICCFSMKTMHTGACPPTAKTPHNMLQSTDYITFYLCRMSISQSACPMLLATRLLSSSSCWLRRHNHALTMTGSNICICLSAIYLCPVILT